MMEVVLEKEVHSTHSCKNAAVDRVEPRPPEVVGFQHPAICSVPGSYLVPIPIAALVASSREVIMRVRDLPVKQDTRGQNGMGDEESLA